MSALGVLSCIVDLGKEHLFEKPEKWNVSLEDLKNQHIISEVALGLKETSTAWFRFKFKPADGEHEIVISDDVIAGDEDKVVYDGASKTPVQVHLEATTHGLKETAIIVKCAFADGDKTRVLRFDGHFPTKELGWKLAKCLLKS